jgi:hypothetical protein
MTVKIVLKGGVKRLKHGVKPTVNPAFVKNEFAGDSIKY